MYKYLVDILITFIGVIISAPFVFFINNTLEKKKRIKDIQTADCPYCKIGHLFKTNKINLEKIGWQCDKCGKYYWKDHF